MWDEQVAMMLIKLENHWENESESVFQSGLPFPHMRVENSISAVSSMIENICTIIRPHHIIKKFTKDVM